MNIPNIIKVRDTIAGLAATPERFDMNHWNFWIHPGHPSNRFNVLGTLDLVHNCGTCGCIGGWTEAIFFNDGATACEILDLDYNAKEKLFFPCNSTGAYDATPEQAVKVLNILIETGIVDWPQAMANA